MRYIKCRGVGDPKEKHPDGAFRGNFNNGKKHRKGASFCDVRFLGAGGRGGTKSLLCHLVNRFEGEKEKASRNRLQAIPLLGYEEKTREKPRAPNSLARGKKGDVIVIIGGKREGRSRIT